MKTYNEILEEVGIERLDEARDLHPEEQDESLQEETLEGLKAIKMDIKTFQQKFRNLVPSSMMSKIKDKESALVAEIDMNDKKQVNTQRKILDNGKVLVKQDTGFAQAFLIDLKGIIYFLSISKLIKFD